MTVRAMPPPGGKLGAALRWTAAVAVALAFHGAVAALLIRTARPEPIAALGDDAVAVDLEPVEGDAAKPDDVRPAVPAEEATTAAAASAPAEAGQTAPPVPPPPVPAPPPATLPDVRDPPPPPPISPPPDPQPPAPPRPETPPLLTPRASAPAPASSAAEDATPVVRTRSAARETAWRGLLVAHLNRFRRFPLGIGGGTARIAFTIDADGRVVATSVAAGSGDAAIDAAARALVQRASPFPAPPAGVTGRALSFVVPVHYDARRP